MRMDRIRYGLSLIKEEYEEVYSAHNKKLNCDDELRDRILYTHCGSRWVCQDSIPHRHLVWTKVGKQAFTQSPSCEIFSCLDRVYPHNIHLRPVRS